MSRLAFVWSVMIFLHLFLYLMHPRQLTNRLHDDQAILHIQNNSIAYSTVTVLLQGQSLPPESYRCVVQCPYTHIFTEVQCSIAKMQSKHVVPHEHVISPYIHAKFERCICAWQNSQRCVTSTSPVEIHCIRC